MKKIIKDILVMILVASVIGIACIVIDKSFLSGWIGGSLYMAFTSGYASEMREIRRRKSANPSL